MKQVFVSLISLLTVLIACNETKQENSNLSTSTPLKLSSYRDTICHMPVRDGIKDTIVLDNKLLGFCGNECRESFIQVLKKEHKR